ncbi:MAG: serine hydrolase domain-containing protein [Oenococcus sp.]|uniref:serine hydrolase domain-containing protein n=1 Tax=Oenococcus sp. TaxID=1979414 RepID=UPI0039EC3A59
MFVNPKTTRSQRSMMHVSLSELTSVFFSLLLSFASCYVMTGKAARTVFASQPRNSFSQTTVKGSSGLYEEQLAAIQQLVQSQHMQGELLVSNHGRSGLQSMAFGQADNLAKTPNSLDGLFPIASLQKAVTALIVGRLIDQGRLNLKDRLSDFYPSIPFSSQITIEMLLEHKSGIWMGETRPNALLTDESQQIAFCLSRLVSTGRFYWHYTDANYILLAGIIAQRTQQTYSQNVIEDLIRPLHLQHTFFWNRLPANTALVKPAGISSQGQAGWQRSRDLLLSSDLGAGDMYANVFDYYKILDAILQSKLLSPETTASLLPNRFVKYRAGLYYGASGHFYAHGADNGFYLLVDISPDAQKLAIFFINQGNWQRAKVINQQVFNNLSTESIYRLKR